MFSTRDVRLRYSQQEVVQHQKTTKKKSKIALFGVFFFPLISVSNLSMWPSACLPGYAC